MNKIKGFCFLLLCLIFFAELIQQETGLVHVTPLKGAFEKPKKIAFSWASFFNGTYQESFSQYHEKVLELHPALVRVRNQIAFSFFNEAKASNVVIGKDKVLYQDFYISALLGHDYIGGENVRQKAWLYADVQNRLRERGIDFFLVIAPGKASFMPEYLPDHVKKNDFGTNNYQAFVAELNKSNASYIDFRKWFIEIRSKVKYPLFPRAGIHWSGYGVSLVSDSINTYLEKKLGLDMPEIYTKPGVLTDSDIRFTDNDIGDAMNLMFPIKPYQMYYPEITFESKPDSAKPNVLMIGDSFNQSIISFYPYFDSLFSKSSRFWFYNRLVTYPMHVEGYYKDIPRNNLKENILGRDVIIIVSTEQNLNDFCFKFLPQADSLLKLP